MNQYLNQYFICVCAKDFKLKMLLRYKMLMKNKETEDA